MNLNSLIFKKTGILSFIYVLLGCSLSVVLVRVSNLIEDIIEILIDNNDVINTKFIWLIIFILIYLMLDFVYYYSYKLVEIKSKKIATNYYFSEISKREMSFFQKNGIGKIDYYITDLAPKLGEYYGTFWQNITINIVAIAILFYKIFNVSYIIAIFTLTGIFTLIFLTSFVSKKISKMTSKIENANSKINDFIQDHFSGIKIIKSLSIVNKRNKLFVDEYLQPKYYIMNKRNQWYTVYIVIYDLLTILFPILVLLLGLILRDKNMVAIGSVVSIYSLTGTLQEPIRNLADSITYYKENKEREAQLKDAIISNEEDDFTCANNLESISIDIEKVEFKERNILNNFKYLFESNKIYTIKGDSGSGKSTLLNIIMHYHTDFNGICEYNGIKQNCLSIYKNIGYVNQTSYLFKDSILSNITMGEYFDNNSINEIIKTCELCSLTERIDVNEKIDWASSNISGGEMQRINLARILIRRPKFVLLDEVTSSLDTETTNRIAYNIVQYAKKYGLALIAVSHKNEFDEYSDDIINL